jgi:hypothetical protein
LSDPSETGSRALVQISDLFGISKPAEKLISAVERGVGQLMAPTLRRRQAKAEIDIARDWNSALAELGLTSHQADLTIDQRAILRLLADNRRRQENRENIALQAAEQFSSGTENAAPDVDVNADWIDRFWRLAQEIGDAQMQSLWARILVRQTVGGGKFSARCLEALSMLSAEEAKWLEQIASVTSHTDSSEHSSSFVITHLNFQNNSPSANELNEKLKKSVGDLHRSHFGSVGIFIDTGWAFEVKLESLLKSESYRLANTKGQLKGPPNKSIVYASGSQFSALGREIISLIQVPPHPAYMKAFSDVLAFHGVRLTLG